MRQPGLAPPCLRRGRGDDQERVDLGRRLGHERPGSRLLAARDLGAATVRIPLTRPEDVDSEVLGWLRRAYTENAAPPPARRPVRRPAPVLGTLTVVIDASGLPGLTCPPDAAGEHHNVHIALCTKSKERPTLLVPGKPWLATEPVPGDSPSAHWEVPVTVRRDTGGLDFGGPYVRGDRSDRNLFLAWGDVPGDGTLRLVPRQQAPARRRRPRYRTDSGPGGRPGWWCRRSGRPARLALDAGGGRTRARRRARGRGPGRLSTVAMPSVRRLPCRVRYRPAGPEWTSSWAGISGRVRRGRGRGGPASRRPGPAARRRPRCGFPGRPTGQATPSDR